MIKLNLESKDMISNNVELISQVFPHCITEREGKKVVDFNKLKEEFTDEVVDEAKEKYELNWPGKRAAINEARIKTNKTLLPLKEKSVDFDDTNNVYIEGDNLEVLKLLQESYLNKIKCIYIDPPYNTGKDFIYKDDFKQTSEEELIESGQIDEDGNKFVQNTETNGRYHSDWLSMMYPRLKLARNLLKEDGVIFISIDDNEYDNLKKLCDEIFGENNFIGTIIRNTNSTKNQSLFLSVSHEQCLVYTKNIGNLTETYQNNKWSVEKNNIKEYKSKVNSLIKMGLNKEEISSELKELTKYPRFIDFTNYWYLDNQGLYRKDNLGGVKNGNLNPIMNPLTKEFDKVPPGGFRYKPEKLEELVNDNRIHFATDGSLPTIKRYLDENSEQRPKGIMSDDQRPDNTFLKNNDIHFDNPKQLAFINRILGIFEDGEIYMDFFSGSSTTAHSILDLNAADNGNRKYIMVQLPETIDEKNSKSAYDFCIDNGLEPIIPSVAQERIKRAGAKIKEETGADIDYGFRVFKLSDSILKANEVLPSDLQQDLLSKSDSKYVEGISKLDIVTSVILDLGLMLDSKIENIGNDNFIVEEDLLFISLSEEYDNSVLDSIRDIMPDQVVLDEKTFAGNDALMTNVIQQINEINSDITINIL